jgi:hypothetical protein
MRRKSLESRYKQSTTVSSFETDHQEAMRDLEAANATIEENVKELSRQDRGGRSRAHALS